MPDVIQDVINRHPVVPVVSESEIAKAMEALFDCLFWGQNDQRFRDEVCDVIAVNLERLRGSPQ